MFVDVMTSLRRTTEDQKRLEEKVTFVDGITIKSTNSKIDKTNDKVDTLYYLKVAQDLLVIKK